MNCALSNVVYIIWLTILLFCKINYVSPISNHNYRNDNKREIIVVAGNFSIDNEPVNIAQYDTNTGIWSNKFQAALFLYGESNGAILDVVVSSSSTPYTKMYVAGIFDTVTKTSQVQLCSFASWDGITFNKVGEGLCPRGVDSSTFLRINTAVLGDNGDIFVGGSFESRVWDGHRFVMLYHVAYFDAKTVAWLPLMGGKLQCLGEDEVGGVNTLAWDESRSVMYIGGQFDMLDNSSITSGIAIWTRNGGIASFLGGGITNFNNKSKNCVIQSIAFEPKSESLFVSGVFYRVNGYECPSVVVWNRPSNTWRCLYQPTHAISVITAMQLSSSHLIIAGWASSYSTWKGHQWSSSYAVARLNIQGYIRQNMPIYPSDDDDQNRTEDNNSDNGTNPRNHRMMLSTPANIAKITSTRLHNIYLKMFKNHRNQILHKSFEKLFEVYSEKLFELSTKEVAAYDVKLHILYGVHGISSHKEVIPGHVKEQHRRIQNVYEEIESIPESRKSTASMLNRTQFPTASPTLMPRWEIDWEWLPGFTGGNGPILRITVGKGQYDGCLFIAGAYDNYPAVMIWKVVNSNGTVNISSIGEKNSIKGMISSVTQVYLPFEPYPNGPPYPNPIPSPMPVVRGDYTIIIIFACVTVGIMMGIGVTFGSWNSNVPYAPIPSEDEDDEGQGATDKVMSLVHLTNGTTILDFRECFERAMKARHLPTHESLLMINPKEIVLSRIIGEGSFGRVWSGQWRNNSVAVKEFVFAQAAIVGGSLERHNIIEEIVGEAGIMACLRHPKILQLYGCSLTMQAIWIVSELCIRGSLRMVLNDKSISLPLIKKLSISMDIADGMRYLHTRTPPIIHRDLKSHNVFITEPTKGLFVAKIGDWGSARAIALTGPKSMTHGVGTACWLSPEVINNAHFSKSSDVYAFGIVLWEIYTRQEMYEGLSAAQIIAKVAHDELRPQIPRDCPWERVMTDCWKTNPDLRPSFQSVLFTLNKIYSSARTKIIQTRLMKLSNSRSIIPSGNLSNTNNSNGPATEDNGNSQKMNSQTSNRDWRDVNTMWECSDDLLEAEYSNTGMMDSSSTSASRDNSNNPHPNNKLSGVAFTTDSVIDSSNRKLSNKYKSKSVHKEINSSSSESIDIPEVTINEMIPDVEKSIANPSNTRMTESEFTLQQQESLQQLRSRPYHVDTDTFLTPRVPFRLNSQSSEPPGPSTSSFMMKQSSSSSKTPSRYSNQISDDKMNQKANDVESGSILIPTINNPSSVHDINSAAISQDSNRSTAISDPNNMAYYKLLEKYSHNVKGSDDTT